jgi:hypothetical protein
MSPCTWGKKVKNRRQVGSIIFAAVLGNESRTLYGKRVPVILFTVGADGKEWYWLPRNQFDVCTEKLDQWKQTSTPLVSGSGFLYHRQGEFSVSCEPTPSAFVLREPQYRGFAGAASSAAAQQRTLNGRDEQIAAKEHRF